MTMIRLEDTQHRCLKCGPVPADEVQVVPLRYSDLEGLKALGFGGDDNELLDKLRHHYNRQWIHIGCGEPVIYFTNNDKPDPSHPITKAAV